jgi:hypothetical protein
VEGTRDEADPETVHEEEMAASVVKEEEEEEKEEEEEERPAEGTPVEKRFICVRIPRGDSEEEGWSETWLQKDNSVQGMNK